MTSEKQSLGETQFEMQPQSMGYQGAPSMITRGWKLKPASHDQDQDQGQGQGQGNNLYW